MGHSNMAAVSRRPNTAAIDFVGPSPASNATIADVARPASATGPATDPRSRRDARKRKVGRFKEKAASVGLCRSWFQRAGRFRPRI